MCLGSSFISLCIQRVIVFQTAPILRAIRYSESSPSKRSTKGLFLLTLPFLCNRCKVENITGVLPEAFINKKLHAVAARSCMKFKEKVSSQRRVELYLRYLDTCMNFPSLRVSTILNLNTPVGFVYF